MSGFTLPLKVGPERWKRLSIDERNRMYPGWQDLLRAAVLIDKTRAAEEKRTQKALAGAMNASHKSVQKLEELKAHFKYQVEEEEDMLNAIATEEKLAASLAHERVAKTAAELENLKEELRCNDINLAVALQRKEALDEDIKAKCLNATAARKQTASCGRALEILQKGFQDRANQASLMAGRKIEQYTVWHEQEMVATVEKIRRKAEDDAEHQLQLLRSAPLRHDNPPEVHDANKYENSTVSSPKQPEELRKQIRTVCSSSTVGESGIPVNVTVDIPSKEVTRTITPEEPTLDTESESTQLYNEDLTNIPSSCKDDEQLISGKLPIIEDRSEYTSNKHVLGVTNEPKFDETPQASAPFDMQKHDVKQHKRIKKKVAMIAHEENILHNVKLAMQQKRSMFGHTIDNTRRLFYSMDRTEKGYLSVSDVSDGLRRLGLGLTTREVQQLVDHIHVDHGVEGGGIRYEELARALDVTEKFIAPRGTLSKTTHSHIAEKLNYDHHGNSPGRASKSKQKSTPVRKRLPLLDAVRENDINAVEVLLNQNKVDVRETDEYGRTALLIASFHTDNVALVSLLLHSPGGLTLLQSSDHDGMTPLMQCALVGNTRILKFLLQQEEDAGIDLRNKHGDTAISIAISENQIECVKLLKRAEVVAAAYDRIQS